RCAPRRLVGGGRGWGVRPRLTARPPPRRFAPTLPTRGRVETELAACTDSRGGSSPGVAWAARGCNEGRARRQVETRVAKRTRFIFFKRRSPFRPLVALTIAGKVTKLAAPLL